MPGFLPTRYLVSRAARAHGFVDPVALLAKLRNFAQPSEVAEPVELLRAGLIFHARGLVNTKAIQHNLDWVWPWWVERQFDPDSESFIPRAFSFSHINLTHRNWTAAGRPGLAEYPIVDPRGLVTPLLNGWSLDFWFLPPGGGPCLPSKLSRFEQALECGDALVVRSRASWPGVVVESAVSVEASTEGPQCRVEVTLPHATDGELVVALRPCNPEGVSFVDRIDPLARRPGWSVNGRPAVFFDRTPARSLLSTYRRGDVAQQLRDAGSPAAVDCPVGMATAAAMFTAASVCAEPLVLRVPLDGGTRGAGATGEDWAAALRPLARLRLGDPTVARLYRQALATLVLLSPDTVYPGPATYRRFWFRDAVMLLHVLLAVGGVERTRRALAGFPDRQRADGYFLSQEGEWDANGEVLWLHERFARLAGAEPPDPWLRSVRKGARWLRRKRRPADAAPAAGLLPAGFSAEHLGPNDYYYWDDFWGVAGLRAAAWLQAGSDAPEAERNRLAADELLAAIETSLPPDEGRRFPGAMPAAPTRRMDSGAVGSLVADYPLQLFPPGDRRVVRTAEYLRDHSSHRGGFFQQMIHSGVNVYLTLHLAQVWLRSGRVEAAWAALDRMAELASPTGQWPEAIHPRTNGGCMGDGQHGWAAAEWVMMVRNCFVREEAGRIVIGSGVRPDWWREGAAFGPTLTPWGAVTVELRPRDRGGEVIVSGDWRQPPPLLEIAVPGYEVQVGRAGRTPGCFLLSR